MNANTIAKNIAETVSITEHPKYVGSPFANLAQLQSKAKSTVMEGMVAEILEKEGHEVHERTNNHHDLRVRFGDENHKTKIEIKGAMLRREADGFSVGPFVMADDFDELFLFLIDHSEVQGWRVNRSILKGLDENGLMGTTKNARMFGALTPALLDAYDCTRVF